jgi:hypothetical protein
VCALADAIDYSQPVLTGISRRAGPRSSPP